MALVWEVGGSSELGSGWNLAAARKTPWPARVRETSQLSLV